MSRQTTTSTNESPLHRTGSNRVAGLDLMRLAAALAVVLFHYGYAGPTRGSLATPFPELAGAFKYGFLGVDLFFLISGYVIAVSAEGRSAVEFAVARVARLYPAYLAAMTTTAIVVLTLGDGGVGMAQWLANLTMLAPAFGQPFMDGAYWSIVLEIVFYGWIALLLVTGLYRRHMLAVIAGFLAIAYLNEVFLHAKPLRVIFLSEYAGLFAAGMLIRRGQKGERRPFVYVLLAAAFCHGLLRAASAAAQFEHLYGEPLDRNTMWLAHAAIFATFLAALALSRLPALAIPRFACAAAAIGALTYPVYLVHQVAGFVLIDRLAPMTGRWGALLLTLAAVIVFARLVNAVLEPPGRRLVRRMADAIPLLRGTTAPA